MGAPPRAAGSPHPWLRPALDDRLGRARRSAGRGARPGDLAPQGFVDLVQMRGLTHAALTGLAMIAAMVVSALVLASDV